MMSMDTPVPRRQRDGNPQFHLETPIQPCICPSQKSGTWGYFSLHLSFIRAYTGSFLLTRPFPSIQMVEKQQKIEIRMCLSPLIKPLLPDIWDWLDAQYPWSRQLDYRGLLQSCTKAAWGSEGNAKLGLFPVIHKEKTLVQQVLPWYFKIIRTPITFLFCNCL